MKHFPKNAKTKNFQKKRASKAKILKISSVDNNQGFIFRDEFDMLVKMMYKGISPELTKELWRLTSELLIKNQNNETKTETNLKQKLHKNIQTAFETIKTMNKI